MPRGTKRLNEYVDAVANYELMPKAVLAAIAFSFAKRINDDEDHFRAESLMLEEWATLHHNGIVPQPVPSDDRLA
jgi:hypothetical protein